MTKYVYGIVHCPNAYDNNVIPDTADIDVGYAWDWFREDNEAVSMTVVTLNPDDYWRGWFFYNDDGDGEDACPCECNTQEHLDLHWESNSGGGHYDCLRYEHIVNGRIVTTRYFKSVGMEMWDEPFDITTDHQFKNRLTT